MSTRVDTLSLIPGSTVCGHRGLGVLGSTILLTTSDGDNGPGILYNDVESGDEGKEFRAFVSSPPNGIFINEDGSFVYDGPSSTFNYELFVDGVSQGFTSVTITTAGESGSLGLSADWVMPVEFSGTVTVEPTVFAEMLVYWTMPVDFSASLSVDPPVVVDLASAWAVPMSMSATLAVDPPVSVDLSSQWTVPFELAASLTIAEPGVLDLNSAWAVPFALSADATVDPATVVDMAVDWSIPFFLSASASVVAATDVDLSADWTAPLALTAGLSVDGASDLALSAEWLAQFAFAATLGKDEAGIIDLYTDWGVPFSLDASLSTTPDLPIDMATDWVVPFDLSAAVTIATGPSLTKFSTKYRTIVIDQEPRSSLASFVKQPAERLDYCFDFGPWLKDCDDKVAVGVAAAPAGISVDEIIQTANEVVAIVSGGVKNGSYRVRCLVTTVGGRKKEAEVVIHVR